MKIGILTFHCAHNYGAVLQCLALRIFLSELGHDVYVVDYRPKYLTKEYKVFRLLHWFSKSLTKTISKFFTEPFLIPQRIRRFRNFEEFIHKYLNVTSFHDELSDYDCIILGSDQIWNPALTNHNYDPVFFGYNAKCKVISYAASSKQTFLSDNDKKILKQYLEKIKFISVREKHLKDLLQPLVSNEIKVVVDPSLLASVSSYETVLSQKILPSNRYILIYEITRHDYTRMVARKIATQLNCEVIEVASSISNYNKDIDKIIYSASPADFLSLIKSAECVVTTSFHGTAFSIKFCKNFYSLRQNNDSDKRIESLLQELGLIDRMIDPNLFGNYTPVNYDDSLGLLGTFIEESKMFLQECLALE